MSLIKSWRTWFNLNPNRALSRLSFSSTSHRQALASDQYVEANYWDREILRMEKREEKQETWKQVRKPRGAVKKPLRGHPKDEEDIRISKTLSWLLRHGAKSEGLYMRRDGYVRVQDLLSSHRLRSIDFLTLERIVQQDLKMRYHLLLEPVSEGDSTSTNVWWIRANQGHTLKDVELQLSEITDAGQVPMAVHGTNYDAWEKIEKEGLSPMKRTHIHLAQSISGTKGVTAGMRSSSQVLIYVDLDKALRSGIKFSVSANGVVLTKGNENGYLSPEFFKYVTGVDGKPLSGWSGVRSEVKQVSSVEKEGRDIINDVGEQAALVGGNPETDGGPKTETREVEDIAEALESIQLT